MYIRAVEHIFHILTVVNKSSFGMQNISESYILMRFTKWHISAHERNSLFEANCANGKHAFKIFVVTEKYIFIFEVFHAL